MRIRAGASTDIGRVRQNNEDSHLVSPPLYAVADGMGGGAAGEVASGIAVHTLQEFVQGGNGHPPTLSEWVLAANRAIYERAMQRPDEAGMGTTITVVMAEDDRLRLAHVGDSRAYLLRDGDLTQLTEDHTRVNRMLREGLLTEGEAAVHPQRNVVTRALGIGATVQVDETVVRVRNGDRLLLCSDGLSGMVSGDAIESILASSEDPQEAAGRLVEAANEAGGMDNITALVLDVDEVPVTGNATHVDTPPAAGTPLVDAGVPPQPTETEPTGAEPTGAEPAPAQVTQPRATRNRTTQARATRARATQPRATLTRPSEPPPAPPPPVATPPAGRRRSRRALVAAAAIVIVAGAAVGMALALSGGGSGKPVVTASASASQAPAKTEKQAVRDFNRLLARALPWDWPIQPTVFPGLPDDLNALGQTTGTVPTALAARIDRYAGQSVQATGGIRGIDVRATVPAPYTTTRSGLLTVRRYLLEAFQKYEYATRLMQKAVAPDSRRAALVVRARSAEHRASKVYRRGYDALTAVWAGVPSPSSTPSPSPSPQRSTPPPTPAPASPKPTSTRATPKPKPTVTGGSNCVGNICITTPPPPSIGGG
jgi:serine/threonine protein phosphatase PrpC